MQPQPQPPQPPQTALEDDQDEEDAAVRFSEAIQPLIQGQALKFEPVVRRESKGARLSRTSTESSSVRHSMHRFCTAEHELQRGMRVPPPMPGRTVGTRSRLGPPVYLPVLPPPPPPPQAGEESVDPAATSERLETGRGHPAPELLPPPKALFYPADVARYLAPHFRPHRDAAAAELQATRTLVQPVTMEPLSITLQHPVPDSDPAEDAALASDLSRLPEPLLPPLVKLGNKKKATLPEDSAALTDSLTIMSPADFVRVRPQRIAHLALGETLSVPCHIAFKVRRRRKK